MATPSWRGLPPSSAWLILIAWLLGLVAGQARSRVAILTDGAPSHRSAMVRFLLYTDGWDTEAILVRGDRSWIDEKLDLYGQVQTSLRKHREAFPEADSLKSVVSEASVANLVRLLVSAGKEEPLHLLGWSNRSVLAEALAVIEKEHPQQVEAVSKGTKIHLLGDLSAEVLALAERWPKLQIVVSEKQAGCFDEAAAEGVLPEGYREYINASWREENILQGHGPLCASYASGESGEGGETVDEAPAVTFLQLVSNGLGGSAHPSFGGWGGRFEKASAEANLWRETADEGNLYKPVWRWLTHVQADWCIRADWCVQGYRSANHRPRPAVNRSESTTVLGVKAKPGQKITLDASATKDPDGHCVVKAWWYYGDAGSYEDQVIIPDAVGAKIEFVVPFDSQPRRHHVMLTVRDAGMPGMFAYRRVVIQAEAGSDDSPPSGVPRLSGKVESQRVDLSWTEGDDPESGIRRYRVYRDGAAIHETVEREYRDETLSEGAAASYEVSALNGVLVESAKSNAVKLRTEADREGPQLTSVALRSNEIVLEFDERLDETSAQELRHYRLTQGVKVLSAALSTEGKTVSLTTSPLPLDREPCFLMVEGVKDRAASPNAVPQGTSYLFLHAEKPSSP